MEVPEAEIAAAFAAREAAVQAPAAGADFMVLPANEAALVAFLALTSQWHLNPASGRACGLRYGAARRQVKTVCKRFAGEDAEAVFAKLQVMERAALSAIRERDLAHE